MLVFPAAAFWAGAILLDDLNEIDLRLGRGQVLCCVFLLETAAKRSNPAVCPESDDEDLQGCRQFLGR